MNGPLITSVRAPAGGSFAEALIVKGHAPAHLMLRAHLVTAEGQQTQRFRAAENGAWTARFPLAEDADAPGDGFRRGAPVSVEVETAGESQSGAARWTGRLPEDGASSAAAGETPLSGDGHSGEHVFETLDAGGPAAPSEASRAATHDTHDEAEPSTKAAESSEAAATSGTHWSEALSRSIDALREEVRGAVAGRHASEARDTKDGPPSLGDHHPASSPESLVFSAPPSSPAGVPNHGASDDATSSAEKDAAEATRRADGEGDRLLERARERTGEAAREASENVRSAAHTARSKTRRAKEHVEDTLDAERPHQDAASEAAPEASEAARDEGRKTASRACPELRLGPSDIGAPGEGGTRPVTLEAVLRHPSYERIEARLRDDRTGAVLAEDHSASGRLQIEHTCDYAPGEHAVALEVATPAGCPGTTASFVVPAAPGAASAPEDSDASDQTGEADDGSDDEATTGLAARLLGSAWATVMTLYLLVIAAGSSTLVVGAASAFLVTTAALHLGFHRRRWATWTLRGLAAFALVIVVLLPYTFLVGMDGDLLGAALSAVGFGVAALLVNVRS